MQICDLTSANIGAATSLWLRAGLTRPWNPPELDLQRALDGVTSAADQSEVMAGCGKCSKKGELRNEVAGATNERADYFHSLRLARLRAHTRRDSLCTNRLNTSGSSVGGEAQN